MCFGARVAMHIQTKFIRLCESVSLGEYIDDWWVCWLGGWDKCRVFFVVMVAKEHEHPPLARKPRASISFSACAGGALIYTYLFTVVGGSLGG
jgi:hypothetical protein